jgi:hypothetical protein
MAGDIEYIWAFGGPQKRRFESPGNTLRGSNGAPVLTPSHSNNDSPASDGGLGLPSGNKEPRPKEVNVVNDFEWTVSPKQAREDVPILKLKEFYVKANPMINQIANNLMIMGEGIADMSTGKGIDQITQDIESSTKLVTDLTGTLSQGTDWLGDKIKGFGSLVVENSGAPEGERGGKNNPLGLITNTVKDIAGNSIKSAGKMVDETAHIAAAITNLAAAQLEGDPLNPYRLMYMTERTGFQYVLPYFGAEHKSLNNAWGDSQPGGSETFGEGAMDLLDKAVSSVGNIMQVRNILEPGKYVEKPQFYNSYAGNKKSYSVSFPLSNTGSYRDVLKNWQLVYLLVYQNSMNRISRTLVAPPVIYEAEIPGVWYSPYAYISNLSIQYQGARRRMQIEVPRAPSTAAMSSPGETGPVMLDTIVPDGYQVTLTVNDLHPESQNFLHHLIAKKDKITTYQSE